MVTHLIVLSELRVNFTVYSENVHVPVEIVDAAFELGAHDLLTPPFTPTSVESAIHSVCTSDAKAIYRLITRV